MNAASHSGQGQVPHVGPHGGQLVRGAVDGRVVPGERRLTGVEVHGQLRAPGTRAIRLPPMPQHRSATGPAAG